MRRLVFYDQVGCGGDPTPVDRVSAQAAVEQAESLFQAVSSVGTPGILAHSWGAYLVYEMLKRGTTNGLAYLILVSPVGLTRRRFEASGERLLARIPPSVIAALGDIAQGPQNGSAIMRALSPYYQAHPSRPVQVTFGYYSQEVYDRVVATLGEYDCRGIADALPRHTLILYGDADIEIPDDTSEIHSLATVQIVPGSGHLSFAEQPSYFTSSVERFLRATESST